MDPIRFAIQNPVKITVSVILLLLFGVIALTKIPVQLTPDVDRPVITVRTRWSGRSPEEIEKSILLEQEEKLKSGFVFRNPNEKGRCGCGESFHV